jgi:large subunit ribosomal protein L17
MTIRKLGRKREHRQRTLRNLATSVILYEQITTTEAKAKAVSPFVEHLISTALTGTLAARRSAKAELFDMNAVRKLLEDIPGRAGTRTSGFVRITKIGPRPGDGAPMARLELLLSSGEVQSDTKVSVRRRTAKADEATPAENA